MAKFTTTQSFADGDQVTSPKLNAIVSGLAAGADLAIDSTLVVESGALRVGVIGATNVGANAVTEDAYGDASIPPAAFKNDSIPPTAVADNTIPAGKLTESVPWSKILPADKAVQADMQSQTADHFVSPAVMKYHPLIPKAIGTVSLTNGSATLSGAVGVASAAESGVDRVITLSAAMANTDYHVLLTYKDTGAVANSMAYSIQSTTQFTIHPGAEAAGRSATFEVKGQLA